MKAIPVNKTAMAAHLKAIESDRLLNQISGDVMNAIYSLQTMMSAYGAQGFRISVTVDDIVVEQIVEDDEYWVKDFDFPSMKVGERGGENQDECDDI